MNIRHSLYWDDFSTRITETVNSLKNGEIPQVRRVAVFITQACNLKCAYCNVKQNAKTMSREFFENIVEKYGKKAIIHITGGEPSVVPWLYPYIKENGDKYRLHLNTNAVICPPAEKVKRLKVSLDTSNEKYNNNLVGREVFNKVVENIKYSIPRTVTSTTYTLTKENYKMVPEFIKFAKKEFKGIYALFFSCYKGSNERFVFEENDIEILFKDIIPIMESELDPESLALLKETLDEKRRLISGIRFPQNKENYPCYLSMSERVFSADEKEYYCSHLYRDEVDQKGNEKHEKCCYGCNRRLVAFNEAVQISLGVKYENSN